MSTRLGTKTGVASIGRKSAAHRFVLTWERASYVVDGESESTSTVGDAVFNVYASATVDHEAIVNVEPFGPDVPGPVVFTSSDTAVATVDETGRVSRVTNGYVRITAANP